MAASPAAVRRSGAVTARTRAFAWRDAGKSGRLEVSAFMAAAVARNDAETDVPACMSFPAKRRAKPHSPNPRERVKGEA